MNSDLNSSPPPQHFGFGAHRSPTSPSILACKTPKNYQFRAFCVQECVSFCHKRTKEPRAAGASLQTNRRSRRPYARLLALDGEPQIPPYTLAASNIIAPLNIFRKSAPMGRSHTWTRKLSYRKDDRAMRPIIIWMPWKFYRVPVYAHGYFSRTFNGLLFWSIKVWSS